MADNEIVDNEPDESEAPASGRSVPAWRPSRLLAGSRTWLPGAIAAVGSTLIVFVASWLGLLSIVDNWVENKFTLFMDDYVTHRFESSRIALIVAEGDSKPNGELGEFNEGWRPHHAELIKRLAEGGAAVIALDIGFQSSDKGGEELKEAFALAKTRTRPILGVSRFHLDQGAPKPETMEALMDLESDAWALSEVALGSPAADKESQGYVRRYLLAQYPNGPPDPGARAPNLNIVPSLALQAVAQYEAGATAVTPTYLRGNRYIRLLGSDGRTIKDYPVLADQPQPENDMNMIAGLVDQHELDQSTLDYHQVFANRSSHSFLSRNFGGKIVVIGVKDKADRWQVSASQHRYGVEIHATAISSLLLNIEIRPLRPAAQFLVIAMMSAVALLLRTVLGKWTGPGLSTKALPFLDKLNFEIKIPVLIIVSALIYLACAFLAYRHFNLIIGITYPLAALFVAYWLVGVAFNRARPDKA
jgi:CHASE2 domain-containing sensor protein